MLKHLLLITGLSTKLIAFNMMSRVWVSCSNIKAEFNVFTLDGSPFSNFNPFLTLLLSNPFSALYNGYPASCWIPEVGSIHVGHFSSSRMTMWFCRGAARRMPAGTYNVTCGPYVGQYLPTLKPLMNSWPCMQFITIHHWKNWFDPLECKGNYSGTSNNTTNSDIAGMV